MASGYDMVKEAITICREVAESLGQREQAAKAGEAATRTSQVATGLEGILNKVFLKTRSSLAFTGPVLENARRVQEDVQELDGDSGTAWENLLVDLEALEGEARILIGKGSTGDVVIT